MAGRGGVRSTSFKPGQSGNPSGLPKNYDKKVIADVKALAKEHTADAVQTLVEVMRSQKAPPAARVSAATALLDRGFGRPAQAIHHSGSIAASDMTDAELAAIASGSSLGTDSETVGSGLAH